MSKISTPAAAVAARTLINEKQLAEITSIPISTWQRRRCVGGAGPRWFKLGGAVRYDLQEVMAWIEGCACR